MQTARLRCQCAWLAGVIGFVMGRTDCVARGAEAALPIRGGPHRGARRGRVARYRRTGVRTNSKTEVLSLAVTSSRITSLGEG
ncbi:hypothetical protein D9M72_421740 [compost metagenome]